jgi:hypothetical protein
MRAPETRADIFKPAERALGCSGTNFTYCVKEGFLKDCAMTSFWTFISSLSRRLGIWWREAKAESRRARWALRIACQEQEAEKQKWKPSSVVGDEVNIADPRPASDTPTVSNRAASGGKE